MNLHRSVDHSPKRIRHVMFGHGHLLFELHLVFNFVRCVQHHELRRVKFHRRIRHHPLNALLF